MLPEYDLDWSKATPNPYAALGQHRPSLGAGRSSTSIHTK
jgi:hypothetical protein